MFAKKPEVDHARVKQFADRGYDSGIYYATTMTRSTLNTGNESFQITLLQPVRDGKYPAVLYLPGLGQSGGAGADMRRAWAESGFVVLSLEPLKGDANAWSTDAARSGDYTFIRHERYSSEVVTERLDVLAKLLEYLKQHSLSGAPGFAHVDLSHVAIAGFDVGAYSAMIAAGESAENVSLPGLSLKPDAVIALSPHADFSGSDFDARYQPVKLPVLSVAGDADSDTHGSDVALLHQAPFQYMPPGNKYLLLLARASHTDIGDDFTAGAASDKGNGQQTGNGEAGSAGGHGDHHGNRSSHGGNDPGSSRSGTSSLTRRAMMGVAIDQVTTAFLNAYIKHDRLSRAWLKNDAGPWLDKIGQLREK
ncbi:MAG: hypothetical protein WCF09_02465 [Gallionella sp.]